jgi:hypothetical protein
VGRSGSTITRCSYRPRRTDPTHRPAVAASRSSPSAATVHNGPSISVPRSARGKGRCPPRWRGPLDEPVPP